MTCIVAKIHNGKVHMAADRLGSNGFTKQSYPLLKKVFKNGEFVLGGTTSYRMLQLLQYHWTPPTKSLDESAESYIFKTVVNSILKCFKDNDFGHKKDSHYIGGEFLMGWKGRLFRIEGTMTVFENERFDSVGSGEYHAVAAMRAMDVLGQVQDEPEKFLSLAIQIAHEYTTGGLPRIRLCGGVTNGHHP